VLDWANVLVYGQFYTRAVLLTSLELLAVLVIFTNIKFMLGKSFR